MRTREETTKEVEERTEFRVEIGFPLRQNNRSIKLNRF